MSSPANSMTKYLANVLWNQWAALGVPAATTPSLVLIDLEALLVTTAIHTDTGTDVRLRDGAISWLAARHEYVATARLKHLISRLDDPVDRESVMRLTSQVAENVPRRLTWPKLSRDVQKWIASTSVAPFAHWTPGLLRLRTRAMFGANAKAEAYAYLATVAGSAELAVIEQRTDYSRRQIDDALKSLVDLGWVSRGTVGNRTTYALTDAGRQLVDAPLRWAKIGSKQVDQLPTVDVPSWVDWHERFRLLRLLGHVKTDLDRGSTISAVATLQQASTEFQNLFHPVPEPIQADETMDHAANRVREWIPDAARRLAGEGIVP